MRYRILVGVFYLSVIEPVFFIGKHKICEGLEFEIAWLRETWPLIIGSKFDHEYAKRSKYFSRPGYLCKKSNQGMIGHTLIRQLGCQGMPQLMRQNVDSGLLAVFALSTLDCSEFDKNV